jgi:alcohol dehydrogenase class IV
MPFEFATAQRIVFGQGSSAQLPALTASMGRRALLVSGLPACPVELAGAAALAVTGEPTFDLVRRGAGEAREAQCDVVVAIGGGSAIDAGKAIAMLLGNGGDPIDYAEVIGAGRAITKPSAPLIAVPTTAGTGTEVTRNAVLGSGKHKVKVSLRSPHMLPRVALLDPALTLGLPRETTANTGMDALSQLIEPFVSCKANAMTDALCREGIRRAAAALPRVCRDGSDAEARGDMMFAAMLSGMALANAGLGAVHGFAAPIGGMFPAPHGAVCAALLAPVMEANLRAAGAVERYREVAAMLTGKTDAQPTDGVRWVRRLCGELGIRPLRAYGIAESDVPELVSKAAAASSMKGNPVLLSREELTEVLRTTL